MSHWSEISGERVVAGSLWIPKCGAWVADVSTALPSALFGSVTLTVGDLSLVGTIVRQGAYAGSRTFRVVGGAGRWATALPARSYTLASGLPLATVLGDLAAECGETLGLVAGGYLGTSFVRLAGPANRTLLNLAPDWWVDSLGITQTTPRAASIVKRPFMATNRIGAAGVVQVATESPGEWLPGAAFQSPLLSDSVLTALAVRHTWLGDGVARIEAVIA